MKVVLTVRELEKPFIPIEAEVILPESFLDGEPESVWKGNRERQFREIFDVERSGTAETAAEVEIVLRGNTGRIKRIGEYMKAGRITVEGDIGMHCGNFMEGGIIEIMGNADSWLGREMRGGEIIVRGKAGDYCGSGYRGEKRGMRGGRIEIMGSAGDFLAEHQAGGEIVVRGNAGDMAGVDMHGGTLTVYGDCTRPCGNMDGGTCYILGTAHDMLPTFEKERETITHQETGTILKKYSGDRAQRRAKGTLAVREPR